MRRIVTFLSILVLSCMVVGIMPGRPASAAEYRCGNQCNGKSPKYVIPSNGIVCANSKKLIRTGHPYASSTRNYDYGLTIRTYYSSVCQTMWATITASSSRPTVLSTYSTISRTISPTASYNVVVPAAGKTVTSVMVDDYSPTQGIAAAIRVSETIKGMLHTEIDYTYTSKY